MRIEWSHVSKQHEAVPEDHHFQGPKKANAGLFDFSASIRQGVTAVVGPGGSGKSALLKLTATWMVPDDGRITYYAGDRGEHIWSKGRSMNMAQFWELHELRELICYVPQMMHLHYHMTVGEDLLQLAQSHRIANPRKRIAELLTRWGLSSYRKTEINELSVGMLKRYMLVQSLLCHPRIWILDEPTEGLDELGKKLLFHELIHSAEDRIVLIATKDMQLAECADNLMLLEKGACRRWGSKKFLTAGVPEGTVMAWYRAMQAFGHGKKTHIPY